jgi:hypothetical protein
MFSGSRGWTDKRAVHQVLEYELKAVGPFIAGRGQRTWGVSKLSVHTATKGGDDMTVSGPTWNAHGREIARCLAGLQQVAQSGLVAELVFGSPKVEQDLRAVVRLGWLLECTPQQHRGAVGCAAGECAPCGFSQHRDNVAIASAIGRQQVHRDSPRVGVLVGEQPSRAAMQCGAIAGRYVLVDGGPHDRVYEPQGLARLENRKLGQPVRQRLRPLGIQPGRRGAVGQSRLLAQHRHRPRQHEGLPIQIDDTQQHRGSDPLRCGFLHRGRIDMPSRASITAKLAEQLSQQERITAGRLGAGAA